MLSNSAFEFVKELGQALAENDFDLPPFPDTAMRVQHAMADPDVDIRKLADIVLSEPALAARLLRIANSVALRRGPMELTEVHEAITHIGLNMVRNVTMAYAARQAFRTPPGSVAEDELLRVRLHSFRVAAIGYVLRTRIRSKGQPHEVMLAGLMHAVGKFYILSRVCDFPELFAADEALRDLLDRWHTSVGRAIVEYWGFNDSIVHAVDEYEILEREPFKGADITDMVLVANRIAQCENEEDIPVSLEGLVSLDRMKATPKEIVDVLEECDEEIQSIVEALIG